MDDPLKRVKLTKPDVEAQPVQIAKAREDLMNVIRNESGFVNKTGAAGEVVTEKSAPVVSSSKRRTGILSVMAAFILLLAGSVGFLALRSRPEVEVQPAATEPTTQDVAPPERVTDLSGHSFRFSADEISVQVEGDRAYHPNDSVDIGGFEGDGPLVPGENEDEGSPAAGPVQNENVDFYKHTTGNMEFTWFDVNSDAEPVEMRMFFFYASDGQDWWVYEVRTYDGEQEGEWLTVEGDFLRTPIGTAYSGDIDIPVSRPDSPELAGKSGRLVAKDARVQPFVLPKFCENPDRALALGVRQIDVVRGSVEFPVVSEGGALEVIDTKTCRAVDSEPYTFTVTSADEGIVAIGTESYDGGFRFNMIFLKAGETTVEFKAIEKASGEVVDVVEIPVRSKLHPTVSQACAEAQAESKEYMVASFAGPLLEMEIGAPASYILEAQLWASASCEPVAVDPYTIEAVSEDPDVAKTGAVTKGLDDGGSRPGIVTVAVDPVGVGETTITVGVKDSDSGEVIAEVDVPVGTAG